MDRKLPNELDRITINNRDDIPRAMEFALSNMGKYLPVTLVEPDSGNVISSFYIKCYKEGEHKYLQMQEFSNKTFFEVFKDEYGDKAEVLEKGLGFRLKF